MDKNDDAFISFSIIILCGFITGLSIGANYGFNLGADRVKNEAVRVGAARYYIDENYKRQFQWYNSLNK